MKEYKILEVKKEKSFEKVQELMEQMSQQGWEVVSVAFDSWSKLNLQLLITFSREKR